MKTTIIACFTLGLALLAGCATTPVTLQQSSPGTYDPALPSQFLTKTPSTGTLVVIRDSGLLAILNKEVISVDGQEIGYAHTSQELTVYLAPGQHEVYVEIGEGSIVATARTSAIFTITPGQSIIMDIHFSQVGGLTITPQNIGNGSTSY